MVREGIQHLIFFNGFNLNVKIISEIKKAIGERQKHLSQYIIVKILLIIACKTIFSNILHS